MYPTSPEPIVSIIDRCYEFANAGTCALESAGLSVEVFQCASQFLSQIDGGRPGCVVVASDMPFVESMPPYERILTQTNHSPLILRCGRGEAPTISRAISMG